MASVGLVLGAGGVVGAAYHAGVLTALAQFGWDARQAELIVGTSAGSGVGATLRAGFPPADMAARQTGDPMSAEAAQIVERVGGAPDLRPRPRVPSGLPRLGSPALLRRAVRRPSLALANLPPGGISTDIIGDRIRLLYGDKPWPDDPLWICAVRLSDGGRMVFGRDPIDIPIATAVEASSAIPGYFTPVEHESERYVDGGLHSPTNADVLDGLALDLVVVVSPMSATRKAQRVAFPSARPLHARALAEEVKILRRNDTPVLTFQPTPADVEVMGRNAMDANRRGPVVESALASAKARLADESVADRVALLIE